MAKQAITFIVNTDRDQDIIHWLEGQTNKSAAIRDAIRAHFRRSDVTLADVYEAIQDLKRAGWMSVPEAQSRDVAGNEPPDIAAALDRLGL